MATLPIIPSDPTLDAMNAAIETSGNAEPARPYLGMSGIGKPCHRDIWYGFRWVTDRFINAKGLRAIQDGFVNEDVTANRLRMTAGPQLWTDGEDGKQIGCEDHSGHFRGHLDGIILGLLQAPKTPHVWENKAVNEKKFNKLKSLIAELGEKQALREWDATYFAQAQLYMHYQKLTRHYLTVNTPGGRATVTCRTEYDKASAQHFIDLARNLIASESPPMRLSDDPAHWQCKFCDHHAVCHGSVLPKPTCRSCAHVTPMLDEQGGWHCQKWNDRIPVETQRAGCDQHLYHPDILSGFTPESGDMAENWIRFRRKSNDDTWINGGTAPGALTSAAAYAAQRPVAVTVVDDVPALDSSVLSELSIDSAIPISQLVSGDLTEQEWPKVTTSVESFYSRWKDQPAKLARLQALIEVIDCTYYERNEKRVVA
jgi:hypothetical protein